MYNPRSPLKISLVITPYIWPRMVCTNISIDLAEIPYIPLLDNGQQSDNTNNTHTTGHLSLKYHTALTIHSINDQEKSSS